MNRSLAANPIVALVIDRPHIEDRFYRSAGGLDHPQLLVGEGDVPWYEGGVRAQERRRAIAGIRHDLGYVDHEPGALAFENPPVPLVAHQRLTAVGRRGAECADNRLPVVIVFSRFLISPTDDVPAVADRHFFRLRQRDVVGRLAWREDRGQAAVGIDDGLRFGRARQANAEHVEPPAVLDHLDHGGADDGAGDHDADGPDVEEMLEATGDAHERRDVRCVFGPHLGTHRSPLVVSHESDDHLTQVRPVVLRMAILSDGLTAGAFIQPGTAATPRAAGAGGQEPAQVGADHREEGGAMTSPTPGIVVRRATQRRYGTSRSANRASSVCIAASSAVMGVRRHGRRTRW